MMDDNSLNNGYLIQGRVTLLLWKYLGVYCDYGLGRGIMEGSGHYSIEPMFVGCQIIYPPKRWMSVFSDVGFGYVRSVEIISVEPVSKFSVRIGSGVLFFQNIRYPIYFGFGFFRSFVGGKIEEGGVKFKSTDNMNFSAFIGYNL